MKISSSTTMEKIASMGGSPHLLEGYVCRDKGDATGKIFRLYPSLSPSRYYEIDESSVADVIEISGGGEKSVVVLREGADVHLVARTRLSGSDLDPDGGGRTPLRGKLPPYADRLRDYLALASGLLLEIYLGTESIPGTGQSGNPRDDL